MCFLCFYPLLYLLLVICPFPFLYQTWLERSVFYYCLPLMPPQASTGISGDADVNCEVYVKIHQNIPKMTTNILFQSKLLSLLFFLCNHCTNAFFNFAIPSHQLLTLCSGITLGLPSTASSPPQVPGHI